MEALAKAWLECERHWRSCLRGQFKARLLNEVYSEFELQRRSGDRDCVSLQGLVCSLGVMFQNTQFLRNRDLYRIYHRVTPFNLPNFISELSLP